MTLTLSILAGFTVGVVQSSFFEWAFHRFWLHRPWRPRECFTAHTLVHHQLCKFEDTFHVTAPHQEEALTFQWWGGPVLVLLNVLPWALVFLALMTVGVGFAAGVFVAAFAVTVALYYAGYEGLHYLMHRPGGSMVERLGVFRFLKNHHRIHHVRMDRNLNVLVPLADMLLRTRVAHLEIPAKTPPAAREIALRFGRGGQERRVGSRSVPSRESDASV